MSNSSISSALSFRVILYSVAIALLFLLIYGYQFNTGDQAEHLPLVYKQIQPELYTQDYFVEPASKVFTVRFFYVQLIVFLSQLFEISSVVFGLTIFCISLSVWSFWLLAWTLSERLITAYISPLFILFIFYNYFSLGTNYIQESILLSGSFGLALTALSISLFFTHHFRWSFFVLGIAGLFHVMFAFNVFLLLFSGFIFFYRDRYSWKQIPLLFIIYFGVSSMMLIPMIQRQLFDTMVYDHSLYYKIQYIFRNYHHFYPSLFKLNHYFKFFGLTGLGLILLLYLPVKQKSMVVYFYVMVLFGLLVYWLGLEKLGVMSFGKTQWPKGTTIWLSMFSSVFIAYLFDRILFHRIHQFFTSRFFIFFLLFFSGSSLLILTQSANIPIDSIQGKYMVGNYRKSDLQMMHEWIEKNTPLDALFLIPATNDAFQCEAKRSTVSGYRAIVHEPWFMLPWFSVFCKTYHVSLEDGLSRNVYDKLDDRYNSIPPAIHLFPEIDFQLINKNDCKYLDIYVNPVFQSGEWVLFSVKNQNINLPVD